MLFRTLLISICFSASYNIIGQSIRINEVVASNGSYLDEYGVNSDWIELYNESNQSINLQGWSLSDDEDNSRKWIFPPFDLKPNGFLLIRASSRDVKEYSSVVPYINTDTEIKYIIPSSPQGEGWRAINYDDSNWNNGINGIGYGDDDDNTIVPYGIEVIYVRYTFEMEDLRNINNLIYHIDYDDAFVAYFNGEEIARDNIYVPNPSYTTRPWEDKEATLHRGIIPSMYDLSDQLDLFNEGKNVLAVQVYNISSSSSDMSLSNFLNAKINGYSEKEGNTHPVLRITNETFHTNFKLSAKSESLYLYDYNHQLIDNIDIENLKTDASYGINENGELAYFDIPTPNAANTTESKSGYATNDITFSRNGGYTEEFLLSLSSDQNGEIRYTLDATQPDASSPLYSGSIYINSNTVVRARIFEEDKFPSYVKSETYIIDNSYDFPVVSLVTDPHHLYNNDTGIYAFGDEYNPNYPYQGANFWDDREIPMHFSYFDLQSGDSFELNAGAKIFGKWSRASEQKSFAIFARNKYGTGEIKYPLFPELPFSTYESIVLRNSGSDWLRTNHRDAMLTSLMSGSGLDYSHNRPVAAYLNGEYWGMYNLREKINEHFIASRHNVDVDSIDLLDLYGKEVHGSNEDYLNLITYITNNSLGEQSSYNYVEQQIDIENYIIYQVAQIYFHNWDWPGNNIKYYRTNKGKWRWIMFDVDFGFDMFNEDTHLINTLDFATDDSGPNWPNPPQSTLLFRKLLENRNFRNRFINRFADELNSRFLPANVSRHLSYSKNKIDAEINKQFERWNGDLWFYNYQFETMFTFGELRHPLMKDYIKDFFDLPAYHTLTIENNTPDKGYVKVNRLEITTDRWSGDYFQTVPVSIEAIPENGATFSHWEGDLNLNIPSINLDMGGAITIRPVFEQDASIDNIVINEINYKSAEDHDTGDWIELYNPNLDPINLGGWSLKDNTEENAFLFSDSITIGPESYLVITRDREDFWAFHPEITEAVDDLGFGLSRSNDAVRLFTPTGKLEDEVFYTSESPWPLEANGEGFTLELITPDLDNSLAENWTNVHMHGSPGKTNQKKSSSEDYFNEIGLQVYPNPFNDRLEVSISDLDIKDLSIDLYNNQGVKVQNTQPAKISGNSIRYNTSDISTGVYFLRITIGNKSLYHKCIKL